MVYSIKLVSRLSRLSLPAPRRSGSLPAGPAPRLLAELAARWCTCSRRGTGGLSALRAISDLLRAYLYCI